MPEGELVVVTNNPRLLKICGLYANKITIIQQEIGETPTEILWQLIEKNKDNFFEKYDQLAAVYVSKYVNTARANSFTIFDRSDCITEGDP